MYKDYPNLPLLEYKCKMELLQDGIKEKPDFDVIVFSQCWGSTALGFEGFGGQMMTEAYTSVFEDRVSGIFFIFFGTSLCYKLYSPSDEFFEDIKNRNLVGESRISKYLKKED